jgi:uncharacterized membrane protein YcjF (UPF0283 family)
MRFHSRIGPSTAVSYGLVGGAFVLMAYALIAITYAAAIVVALAVRLLITAVVAIAALVQREWRRRAALRERAHRDAAAEAARRKRLDLRRARIEGLA